jgi:transposase
VEIGVGIDIARYRHVVQFMGQDKRPIRQKLVIPECRKGYDRLAKVFAQLARKYNAPIFRCVIDDASVYGRNLQSFLKTLPHNLVITIANPLLNRHYKKAFLKDNKSDDLDAQYVARFAISERPAPSALPDSTSAVLKTLCSRLRSQRRQTRRISNQIHQLLAMTFPEFALLFKDITSVTARALLRRYPTAEKAARASAKRLARFRPAKGTRCLGEKKALAFVQAAKQSVASLKGPAAEHAVLDLLDQLELSMKGEEHLSQAITDVYTQQHPNHLLSIPCIGAYSAGIYTAFIGDVRRFASADKLVGYFGVYPVEDQSGQHRGRKIMSSKGNDVVRQVLFMNALAGIRSNPILKELYKRKRAEGKSRMVSLGHCMRKLLHIIYAVLMQNQPFNPDACASNRPSEKPGSAADSPAETEARLSDGQSEDASALETTAAPARERSSDEEREELPACERSAHELTLSRNQRSASSSAEALRSRPEEKPSRSQAAAQATGIGERSAEGSARHNTPVNAVSQSRKTTKCKGPVNSPINQTATKQRNRSNGQRTDDRSNRQRRDNRPNRQRTKRSLKSSGNG